MTHDSRTRTPHTPSQHEVGDSSSGDQQFTILLIDDEPDGLETTRLILEMEGFRVLTAASGAEALLRIGETRPDVLILDVMMPGMTGLDLCVYLRDTAETKSLPIILCSAHTMPSHSNAGLYDRALQKPVEIPELMQAIRALLPLKRPT